MHIRKYKCTLILAYFGKFHNYFDAFLNTCSYNKNIDFLIFTDNDLVSDYSNIKIIKMQFDQFAMLFKKKIDSNINLNTPYKLCDFKPTYGFVLSEYLVGSDYWGVCDCDIIFGDLYKFLEPLFESQYDKIFTLGHLMIFKNTTENNSIFKDCLNGKCLYKDYLFREEICWFDETYHDDNNINTLFKQKNKKIYDVDMSLNPRGDYFNFYFNKYYPEMKKYQFTKRKNLVCWEKGLLFNYYIENNKLQKQEVLYLHLQNRKIINKFDNSDSFVIIPNRILPLKEKIKTKKEFKKHYFKITFIIDYLRVILFRIKRKLSNNNRKKYRL